MDVDALLATWRAAEAKLYPMVVVSPHQYEANLTLVRAMTDDLSECATVDDLVAAYAHRDERLTIATRRTQAGKPSPEVAPLLIDAAFQARYRELPAELAQAQAARRIDQAGNMPGWVIIAAAGDENGAGTGFSRVEMRLPDGLGMHTYIDIDATTFLPLYGIELLALDPATGEYVGTNARPDRREFTDKAEWRAAVDAIKAGEDA